MWGRMPSCATIDNRRKLARVNNPRQDTILPHTRLRIEQRGRNPVATERFAECENREPAHHDNQKKRSGAVPCGEICRKEKLQAASPCCACPSPSPLSPSRICNELSNESRAAARCRSCKSSVRSAR